MKTKLSYIVATIFYLQIVTSRGQPIQNVTSKLRDNIEYKKTPSSNNKTIGELIMQQTESVKKIVADQNRYQASTIDYPIVTKLEPDYSAEAKKQIEKLSIEELKIKCQHFSKLFQVNKTSLPNKSSNYDGVNSNLNIVTRPSNHKPYDSQRQPVYIQLKSTSKPKYSTTPKPNGFYITQSTITQKTAIHTPPTPIKYIRLEPVILQKTILSDGRTVYYWHRSLPTAVEIASDTAQNNHISTSPVEGYSSYNNNYDQSLIYDTYRNIPSSYGNSPYRYASLPQNPYTPNAYITPFQNAYVSKEDGLVEEQKSTEIITESSTTSTTEPTSYGFGFGSFLPFYSYRQEVTPTNAESTTTTTTTREPTTQKLKTDDLLYAQQLKFIIPVPYENLKGGISTSVRSPWDFDQYAYYPKELQPNTMNVEVPYNPTFHMIRAVAVPNGGSKASEEIHSA